MRRAFLFVLLGALVIALPVYAETNKSGGETGKSGEIGLDLGRTNFDSNVSNESGTGLAIRGGYNFTDLFEVEGQYSDTSADDQGTDITMNTLMVNAVFNFHPRENIVPYALGGIGQASMEVKDPTFGNFDDDASAYQLAVGSRFLFGAARKAGLRVELCSLSEKTFNDTSRHTSLTAGFTWRLGQ